ncbi:hypothetical protein L1987_08426 [Smallanthus sonchifolius]|uniref:Uncharacterized protein n=1 Tax=Smallanthus sonchifolius TaxID=185202 RepID=A0ACB9JMD7_9ASTR|nr:hypothetical protein L1987_08426 [Smallanthus sonchifolius]
MNTINKSTYSTWERCCSRLSFKTEGEINQLESSVEKDKSVEVDGQNDKSIQDDELQGEYDKTIEVENNESVEDCDVEDENKHDKGGMYIFHLIKIKVKMDKSDHSYILKEDIGYACCVCGLIQRSIESIIEFQRPKV